MLWTIKEWQKVDWKTNTNLEHRNGSEYLINSNRSKIDIGIHIHQH